MSIDTSTQASLTREQVQAILVQPLQAKSVFLSTPGLRIFDTNGSQVRIPRLVTADTATFVAEGAQIPTKEIDTDEVVLLPSTMKGVKTITPFTNELARQSVVALDAAIRDAMVTQVSATLDRAFIAGTAVNEPQGIITLGTAATVAGTAVGTPTLDDLMDAVGAALSADVDANNLRWMMNSRDWITMRKLKDADQRYQLQPDPTAPGAFTLFGFPVTVTNHIPKTQGAGSESTIVLADFSQIAVARDLNPQVTILSELYADYDKQAIRVVARYDMKPLNPKAVVLLTGVTA